MRQVTFLFISAFIFTTFCSAVGLAVGGYYVYGMPIGELTASEAAYMGDTVTIDTENGIPFKMGHLNFGGGGVLSFFPFLNVEAGVEIHGRYKNEEATFRGTAEYQDQQINMEWDEDEDNITWSMINFYGGNRVKLLSRGNVKLSADIGLILSRSKIEPEEEWVGQDLQKGQFIKALNPGVYFGGIINLFVSGKTAITIPVRYNHMFGADYEYYVQAGPAGDYYDVTGYTEKWKPPSYITVGAGIEYSVL
jgi:hypothetical protein